MGVMSIVTSSGFGYAEMEYVRDLGIYMCVMWKAVRTLSRRLQHYCKNVKYS